MDRQKHIILVDDDQAIQDAAQAKSMAGADGLLEKPFKMQALHEAVSRLLLI